MKRCIRFAVVALAAATVAFASSLRAEPGIAGTMDITYNTRTPSGMEDGAPKKGVQDTYKIDLMVNGTNQFQGTISRQPRITQLKIRTVQQPRYDFNVNLFVALKDGTKPNVGSWLGPMAVDEKSGAFLLDGEADRALRINVTAGSTFTSTFGGRFYGKAADKSKLSLDSIKRTINGKTVEKKFQADPMRFENMRMAAGPNPKQYPEATVTGELTFDREDANYYAKGLRFTYQFGGQQVEDVVTGTIKWVEDPARVSNGKGHYEFNLRFNEDKAKPAPSDDKAFGGSDDDLFFAVDKSIPALTGAVNYVDTMAGDVVQASKVTYDLKANGLTAQQVMNFAKLWVITVGPTNDE